MNKSDRIRKLLSQGVSVKDVAKRVGVKPSFVYVIRWQDKNKNKNKNKNKKKPKAKKGKAQFKGKRSKEVENAKRTVFTPDAVLEKAPTKLLIQPQYKETALKLLGMEEADLVNHPPHYKSGGIETIDFIEAKDLNYRMGNAVKYVSRAGKKVGSDPIKDLEKAVWYLLREIAARKKA